MNFEKNEVAYRYAKAIFEQAVEAKNEEQFLKEVTGIKDLIEYDSTVLKIFSSPLINLEKKIATIREIKLDKFTEEFLLFLLFEKRLNIILPILEKIRILFIEYNNEIDVEVTIAYNINKEEMENINNIIKSSVNKKLNILYKVDEKILGGFIIKIGSKLLDVSLLRKLNNIKDFSKVIVSELDN